MDASSWIYTGEGGKHAIFEFIGTSSEWEGRALRLTKSAICGCASKSCSPTCNDSTGFVKTIVMPLFSSYVDEPHDINLSSAFVYELRRQALESGRIPMARLPSWNIDDQQLANHVTPATLMWNYKRFPGHASTPCLSVEIKPKAGYVAISPLVCPTNRAKYKHPRFTILQELAAQGLIKKGWQSEGPFIKSSYNPLDLYSGNLERIVTSLQLLFDQPQNNLKVWFADHLLIGYSDKHPVDEFSRDAALQMFGTDANDLMDHLIPLLAEILFHEKFLSVLVRLQMLDFIDAHGARLIYNRLLSLSHDDSESVNKKLSERPVLSGKQTKAGTGVMESPFCVPECPTLKLFTQEVQNFAQKLTNGEMTEEVMDQVNERAVKCTSLLSSEACVFLIQNWLFSLAMSDVSFFVTIRRANASELPLSESPNSKHGPYSVVRVQSDSGPGLVVQFIEADGERKEQAFLYCVKLVDCDNKPVSKLLGQAKKEAVISLFQG